MATERVKTQMLLQYVVRLHLRFSRHGKRNRYECRQTSLGGKFFSFLFFFFSPFKGERLFGIFSDGTTSRGDKGGFSSSFERRSKQIWLYSRRYVARNRWKETVTIAQTREMLSCYSRKTGNYRATTVVSSDSKQNYNCSQWSERFPAVKRHKHRSILLSWLQFSKWSGSLNELTDGNSIWPVKYFSLNGKIKGNPF